MLLFVDLKRNISLFLWLVLGDVEGDNLLVLAGSLVVASLSDPRAPGRCCPFLVSENNFLPSLIASFPLPAEVMVCCCI